MEIRVKYDNKKNKAEAILIQEPGDCYDTSIMVSACLAELYALLGSIEKTRFEEDM